MALSVGLDGFAVSISLGLKSVNYKVRTKVVLIFGIFETAMPLIGIEAGRSLTSIIGHNTNLFAGSLLTLTGLYQVLSDLLGNNEKEAVGAVANWRRLSLVGLAVSIDNFFIGVTLGARKVPLVIAAVVIAIVGIGLILLGLELGHRVGNKVGKYSDMAGGLILMMVGLAIVLNLL